VRQCIFLLFGVIVNIFLETGIVLLLLRSQVASSDRTHTDAPEGERERERGGEREDRYLLDFGMQRQQKQQMRRSLALSLVRRVKNNLKLGADPKINPSLVL